MLVKLFISSLLVINILHCTQSKYCNEKIDEFDPEYGKHDKRYVNGSGIHVETIKVSKLHEIIASFDKHAHASRFIRSADTKSTFNGTNIKKPHSRLIPNKTISSKVLSQIHTFFSDKAREDAYQTTEAEDHPYSVSYLLYNRRGEELGICSGTLVRTGWVVTAAHCLVDEPVHRVKVFGGIAFNIFRPPKQLPKRSQVRTSYEFFANPRYDPYSDDVDYDIGLIKIDPPFLSTRFLSPIPMTSTPWNFKGYRKCLLTAFGAIRDEQRSPDDYIRKTQHLLVNKPCDCMSHLNEIVGTHAVNRYVCMKPERDFGICSGDSGGGLICDGELRATVSYSLPIVDLSRCKLRGPSGSGECGDVDMFSIFQDVYPSLTWIKKNAFHINTTSVSDGNGASRRNNLGAVLSFVLFGLWCTSIRY